MATKTIPQLPAATSVVAGTLFPIVNDPAGTPVTQKATGTQLDAYIRSAGGALTATTLDGSGGALTINTAQADKDVVVSSTGMVNLLFTDAGNNRVGINTATPTVALQVVGTVTATTFSGDGSALTSLPAISTAAFLTVAGNPATPVNANCWYNSTANTFRGYTTVTAQAWSTTGSLAGERDSTVGGGGTESAAVVVGGYSLTVDLSSAEKYNGSTWSSAGSVSTAGYRGAARGTSTSTLYAGGVGRLTTTDSYNGTTWTSGGSLAIQRNTPAMAAASNTSALIFGGENSGGYVASSESYNGTTWASGGALSQVVNAQAGVGTSSAALAIGGYNGTSTFTTVEVYNGSTWSLGTAIGTATRNAMGGGTTTSCLLFGGRTPTSPVTTTQSYNGTTWTAQTGMSTAKREGAGVGASSAGGLVIGGTDNGGLATSTCEINAIVTTAASKTFTVS